MAGDRSHLPDPVPVTVTPFRDLPIGNHRVRRVSTTASERGKAVVVNVYTVDGRRLPDRMCIYARDLPAFLTALTEAAAAIGVEPQTKSATRDGAALP